MNALTIVLILSVCFVITYVLYQQTNSSEGYKSMTQVRREREAAARAKQDAKPANGGGKNNRDRGGRNRRHKGGKKVYNEYNNYYYDRPYGYWSNFITPDVDVSYYPYGYYPAAYGFGGGYAGGYDPIRGMWTSAPGLATYEPLGRYDYMQSYYPTNQVCWAQIGIEEAFGPYTAGVAGKQQWKDWGGRNGFQQIALDKSSYTNDHAIVSYQGLCAPQQTKPPGRNYQIYPTTPNWF
jgi:hypothetical protein